LEGLDPDTIRLLLASKAVEPFKNYTKYISNQVLVRLLLQAANNYNNINYAVGKVLHDRINAARKKVTEYTPLALPDYVTAFGLTNCTEDPNIFANAYYKTSKEQRSKDPMYLVRKFQCGDFGSWLFTPYRQDVLSESNLESMRGFGQHHNPILYMNQAARAYIEKAPDFGVHRKAMKKAHELEKQRRAKNWKEGTASTDDSKTSDAKKVHTEEEMEQLKDAWS
jgi:hypothetical protein